jgi:ribulose-phosphate 3-epimerase
MAYRWRQELGLKFRIEVDGGIDLLTSAQCAQVGADTFVSGTALFKKRRLGAAVAKMRAIVTGNPVLRKPKRRR